MWRDSDRKWEKVLTCGAMWGIVSLQEINSVGEWVEMGPDRARVARPFEQGTSR